MAQLNATHVGKQRVGAIDQRPAGQIAELSQSFASRRPRHRKQDRLRAGDRLAQRFRTSAGSAFGDNLLHLFTIWCTRAERNGVPGSGPTRAESSTDATSAKNRDFQAQIPTSTSESDFIALVHLAGSIVIFPQQLR